MDNETKRKVVFFLKVWLEEAILKANYLLTESKKSRLTDEFIKRRSFEEHYLLTATTMSRKFSKQLLDHAQKNLKDKIKSFYENTEKAVFIRNSREHFDEYIHGGGRHPEKFIKETKGIACDASASVQLNDYMLGGQISVEIIKKECELLLENFMTLSW